LYTLAKHKKGQNLYLYVAVEIRNVLNLV